MDAKPSKEIFRDKPCVANILLLHSKLMQSFSSVMHTRPTWLVVGSVIGAGILNALFVVANTHLFLPLFFDSIFTACVAALFGWFPGLLAGLWSNLACEIMLGFPMTILPFAICNMSTGLIIGIMSQRGQFRSGLNALVALLLVTASNSVLGALIATFAYGGITGSAAVDYVVVGLLAAGRQIFSATFLARIPANLVDKGIAVFVAYFLLRYMVRRFDWSAANHQSTA